MKPSRAVAGATIAAIASPPGLGAVGLVRLSGPASRAVLAAIFKPLGGRADWPPQYLRLGRVVEPESGRLLDEALAAHFKAPRSFTGEDSAEIHGHGGPAVLASILQAALSAGAVLAEPGEFTRRAFMNGRLDLSQAEAVAELVAARSQAEADLALRQLGGALKARIETVRRSLFEGLALLEAGLDFHEEIGDLELPALRERLRRDALAPLDQLLEARRQGRLFKDGLSLALVGAPNVGKSSLFNALAGENRALVSDVPGTTRDYLTAEALWQGLRIELCDTAGLSAAPADELEALGQRRSRERLAGADLVLWVDDLARLPAEAADQLAGNSQSQFAPLPPEGRTLMVWNKLDLVPAGPPPPAVGGFPSFSVSAKTGQGLSELRAAIVRLAVGSSRVSLPEVAPGLRHQKILENSRARLTAALEALDQGQVPEIIALELRDALHALDLITGRTTPEHLLDEIFSRFCLGK